MLHSMQLYLAKKKYAQWISVDLLPTSILKSYFSLNGWLLLKCTSLEYICVADSLSISNDLHLQAEH